MKCKFMPGDRVVCVDATPAPGCIFDASEAPIEGHVYTVASVLVDGSEVGITLRELQRCEAARLFWGDACGYLASRFRPARDIEQFREIVASVQHKAREPA